MKSLKCSSCGAGLRVEDNKEYAVCDHCGSRYKLNEDLTINIRLDDNMKDVINNGLGMVKHASKFIFIPIIMIMIIVIIGFTFAFKSFSNSANSDWEKKRFNNQFVYDNGTKSDFFVGPTLDKIIQSNKTHDNQIVLVFDKKEVTSESEIINIKHSLKGNYEVLFSYDDDGFINKIIVESIK